MTALLIAGSASAQTVISAPPNKYSVQDDVKVGKEAASAVEREQPILRDDEITAYVRLDRRAARRGRAGGSSASGVPVLLQGGQRRRHQCLRTAWRA